MIKLLKKLSDRYSYYLESIKNRYPCKIIYINKLDDFNTKTEVRYLAATKVNIRTATIEELLADSMLVEKFHPTDGVKLGFLACGEILLKRAETLEEAKRQYLMLAKQMFLDVL